MTNGQQRAVRELERLHAADPEGFELSQEPLLVKDRLVAIVSLRLGPIETREGGLDLREREEFILVVPPDFPFDKPWLNVSHTRFRGFPHVIWGTQICLYQSSIEWNPADGLFGFFDRLKSWLGKAALNDMDPLEGPLEPPHHNTDLTQVPFVIRADAPCAPGQSWLGLALLEKHQNRTELIGWNDASAAWPDKGVPAFAVILEKALPMEFPTNGAEFFHALNEAGMERSSVVKNLALAALLTPEGEPIYFVLGLPMRRDAGGSQRIHIAVWTIDATQTSHLKLVLPEDTDTEKIAGLREEILNLLAERFELGDIKWCQVLEDRSEIVVRRDAGTAISWFYQKRILILGCGALGSWIAEYIARACPSAIDLVDNSIVKPGVLARQNFLADDIGANKAVALARRIRSIDGRITVSPYPREGHGFLTENPDRPSEYDAILDCTASAIFQMKLERDWSGFRGRSAPFISLLIDGHARHCICVVIPKNADAGVWDAYLSLKQRLCLAGSRPGLISAFYSDRAAISMFQPEPGCSDPTFHGSTADVTSIASTVLNASTKGLKNNGPGIGIALTTPEAEQSAFDLLELPRFKEVKAGNYRIRIATSIFAQARAWVKSNNRLRSPAHETGGLLWGFWDDAVQAIWLYDISGPPPDSRHNPAHFVCGIEGTREEHKRRMERTHGGCGFIGHWHTHPDFPSQQSGTDISSMATLVSSIGHNQKRSMMLIFGRTGTVATAGIYVYESQSLIGSRDLISVGWSQLALESPVV